MSWRLKRHAGVSLCAILIVLTPNVVLGIPSQEETLLAARKKGKWGFLSLTGEVVIQFRFDRVWGNFSGEFLPAAIHGKYGFIGRDGQFVIQPQFDDARPFFDGRAVVAVAQSTRALMYGYIDTDGSFVIPVTLRDAMDFSNGRAYVSTGLKQGYIDVSGKWVIDVTDEAPFSYPKGFSEGLAITVQREEEDVKCGYMDRNGRVVIPPSFTRAGQFSEGLAAVVLGSSQGRERAGFIDRTGKLVLEIKSDVNLISHHKSRFSEGLAAVIVGGRWGFIDTRGETVIAPQFESYVDPHFAEGLACVGVNRQFGYINRAGLWVIAPRFDEAFRFRGGVAHVTINEGEGLIDKTGRYLYGPVGGFHFEGGEGAALADAVVIVGARSHKQGIRAEYRWLARHYGDHEVKGQSYRLVNGKAFDVIEVLLDNGTRSMKVYFDITDVPRRAGRVLSP